VYFIFFNFQLPKPYFLVFAWCGEFGDRVAPPPTATAWSDLSGFYYHTTKLFEYSAFSFVVLQSLK
jgi:hypothetical protein